MTIVVGDRVRSFDFDGRDLAGERACYVDGVVTEIGRFGFPDCDRYEVAVDKRVFAGLLESVPADHKVYPPVNGVPKLGGRVPRFTDGVVKMEGGAG